MSEHRPTGEFGNQADQLEWLVESCRFLAFRPDKADKQLENLAIADTYQGCESSRFRLDDASVVVIADYPESTWDALVTIEMTGAPQRDVEGQWFAIETAYKVKIATQDEESREPEDLSIAVERQNIYKDLDGALLPEQYAAIKEEYDAQRIASREVVEGLKPDEVPNPIDIEAYRGARLASALEMMREGTIDLALGDATLGSGFLSEVSERALRNLDGGDKLRPYVEALEQKGADALHREIKDKMLQDELGLILVGDEELGSLIEKIKRLASNPDAFYVTGESTDL